MTDLPAGYVDPLDQAAVAEVVRVTVQTGGLTAVADLLARLPGTRTAPEVPKGFLRPAVPAAIWLGAETCWSSTEPPTLLQVVGGVVLHRTVVSAGEAPELVGREVTDLVRRTGASADASAVLTAAREVAGG
jgi:hypothetical protein